MNGFLVHRFVGTGGNAGPRPLVLLDFDEGNTCGVLKKLSKLIGHNLTIVNKLKQKIRR